jgi:hypothetical protein
MGDFLPLAGLVIGIFAPNAGRMSQIALAQFRRALKPLLTTKTLLLN